MDQRKKLSSGRLRSAKGEQATSVEAAEVSTEPYVQYMYNILEGLRAHDSCRLHICKLHIVNEHYFYQILLIAPHVSGLELLLHLLLLPVFSTID